MRHSRMVIAAAGKVWRKALIFAQKVHLMTDYKEQSVAEYQFSTEQTN